MRELTVAEHVAIGEPRVASESKRRFWLAWMATFGVFGSASGIFALSISFLTACSVLQQNRGLAIMVSTMLIGCLAAMLLAAHGMDRLAALKRDSGR